MDESTLTARTLLSDAENVIILAGAGMSAEIGTGTYWSGPERQYAGNLSIHGFTDLEHAHGAMWDTHRAMQIDFYHGILDGLINTDVNNSTSPYRILHDYLEETGKNYFIMTSNVDGAFVRSGFSAEKIYEIHGTRLRSQCLDFPVEHGIFPTNTTSGIPTQCPECKGDTRPNCLFFVDFAFNPAIARKQQDQFTAFRESLSGTPSTVLEIGAGTTIATIRNQSLRINSKQHIPVIRINPHDLFNDGGLKNILPKSKIAPFVRIQADATPGLLSILR